MARQNITDLVGRIEAAGGTVAMLLTINGVVDDGGGVLSALGRKTEQEAIRLVEGMERAHRAELPATDKQVQYILDLYEIHAGRAHYSPAMYRADPPSWADLKKLTRKAASRQIRLMELALRNSPFPDEDR